MSDLLVLICDLTNPHDGEPSLWDQLLAGVAKTGQSSGAKPASRLPTDAGVLSLVTEVETWTRRFEGRTVPARLRNMERRVVIARPQWTDTLTRWIREAHQALGLIRQPNVALPRGMRCHECGEAWVTECDTDGATMVTPCLVLIWQEPHRETIQEVACLACHGAWASDVLLDIAERNTEPIGVAIR